jgi:hypothetical protein
VLNQNSQNNSSLNNDAAYVALTRKFSITLLRLLQKIPISIRCLFENLLMLVFFFLNRFPPAAGALPADQTGHQQHLDRDGSLRGEFSRSHSVSPDFGINPQVRPKVRRSRLQDVAGLGDCRHPRH